MKIVTATTIESVLRGVWGEGEGVGKIGGKVKEWWEGWTGGEWKEWEKNEGIVYMWLSTKSGKCYVGSTKGIMMERAKTHLRMVRRVKKEWERTGEKKKIDDKEIMEIHYEIAREPKEWVMIPLSGELIEWKRIEKRLIRMFGNNVNVL